MDPISASLKVFQQGVREFRESATAKILCIVTPSEHIGTLAKMLRAEEWQPDNKSPFLIFQTAYFNDLDGAAEEMCQHIGEHYALIKKEYEKSNIVIPDLIPAPFDPEVPIDEVIEHIVAFDKCLTGYLDPVFFCWMPTVVKKQKEWQKAITWFAEYLLLNGNRLILTAEKEQDFERCFKDYDDIIDLIYYKYDQEETTDYFGKLFAPPAKGHMTGTPSGSAAPDVEPPPRKSPQVLNDDNARLAIEALNLPAILTQKQAQELRTNVFAAAMASGQNDEDLAIEKQLAACNVCEEAGVKLEHSLMRLTLANYLLQFKRMDEALGQYRIAESLAIEILAYPQLAQIRMAVAFIYMRKRKTRTEAIHEYEQAAAAATIGDSPMLYLESLRMAGTCYLKEKDGEAAMLCWQAAVAKSKKMSIEEIRGSTFLDIVAKLIDLLEDYEMNEQAESIKLVVQEAGAKFDVCGSIKA
jgi:tetratricopeptide (TPR) repeat protein